MTHLTPSMRRVIGSHVHNNFPPYIVRDPSLLLTSFAPPAKPRLYAGYDDINTSPFMKCDKVDSQDRPVPSGCAQGGRSGYSVRMISCKTVKNYPSSSWPRPIDPYCK